MAGQPQTPSHPYTGGAPSIFDTTPPGDTLDYSTPPPPPQPTTWYRYWNEQYNRYFFWQETNSISTWDLPPDGDTVIDYTTKEVVSGPDSGSYDDTTATTNLPILQQPNEIPNNNNHYSRADEDSGRNMFNRHDHSATSSSSSAVAATSSLFEVHANSPAVRTDDFDILTGGRSVDSIIPRSMFQEQDQGTYPTDLSWLTNQDPQLVERSASSTSYPPVVADPLFSTATRSALYERAADYSLAGPGYHQSRQPTISDHRQQACNILDKTVQEEHDRLIAERMQAQLDEEYKERLSNAPLPCEAAQHKQCKKERKMGKMPKMGKPSKGVAASSSSNWGSSRPPSKSEQHLESAEENLAHEMAAHGIVLKTAKVKGHQPGRQQQQQRSRRKVISVGRK